MPSFDRNPCLARTDSTNYVGKVRCKSANQLLPVLPALHGYITRRLVIRVAICRTVHADWCACISQVMHALIWLASQRMLTTPSSLIHLITVKRSALGSQWENRGKDLSTSS